MKVDSSLFKAKLSDIGTSRMECDYKLVENEGLFQEYLEMGKFKQIRALRKAAFKVQSNLLYLLPK